MGPPNEGNIYIYTWYISGPGIYCQLGDYILPTTRDKNLKNPLNYFTLPFGLQLQIT